MWRLTAFLIILVSTNALAQDTGYIEWSKTNKLKWSDFTGKPDKPTAFLAATGSYPYYTYQWYKEGGKNKLMFSVVCRFYKNRSYSMPDGQTAEILAHEQTHFDISEFFTRQLAEALNDAEYTANYKQEIAKIYDDYIVKLSVMQHTFDAEARHGMDIDRELEWERYVALILDKKFTLQKALDRMPRP